MFLKLNVNIFDSLCVKGLVSLIILLGSVHSYAFNRPYDLALDSEKSLQYKLFSNPLENTDIQIDTTFRAYNFDERQDTSQVVQFYIQPQFKMNLHKTFSIRGHGSLSLGSARVQTRFEDPSFNTMNLNELVLSYHPAEYFNLEAGALNEDELQNMMLVNRRSFPGAQIKSHYEFNNFQFRLKAQYSIPNSTSLSSDRTQNEATPSFITQGFDWTWKPRKWARLRGNLHHFAYDKLPSIVAFESGRLGNEVIGANSSESFFAYDFDGFSQSYAFSLDISKMITQNISLMIIDNNEAPSDRNRSQWTGLGWDFYFEDYILSPHIAYFYAESDSAPALYSAVQLGRNNREGLYYGMQVQFKDYGFAISANYVQANLIEPDPVQNDLRSFEFLVELPSVKF